MMGVVYEVDFDELDKTVWLVAFDNVRVKRTWEREGIEIAIGSDILVVSSSPKQED